MGEDMVTVSYAVGWDTDTRRAFGPLTRAEAEARDAAGDPYVVLHRLPGREVPAEVHLVAWRDLFVGQWAHDELGRRTHEIDLRLLEDDRLFLRRYVERRYASPEQPDLAPDAWQLTVELLPGGRGRKMLYERGRNGGSFQTLADVPEERRWHDRSGYGVRAADAPRPPDGPGPGAATAGEPAFTGGEEPASLWRPPKPLRMELPVDDLFRPGNPFPMEPWEKTETAEPQRVAMVRIPSGRLAVSDALAGGPRELAERIPPGEYALESAVVVGEGEYEGERFPVTDEPAVRLLIRDEPAVAWELALSEGDDPRLLLDGHAYGFGTDGASGSFADAAAWETLSEKVRRCFEEQDDDVCESVADGHIRAVDEATGGELVTFCTGGDGTWPVWLGRSAAGALVSVVVITAYL
ncbi:DUF4241 domain-containing protein [Actinacidiphila glaucinigra]|uniref:DUF4241 domain-containing protein n=1 Tax=Actinacidiphila glaucinigra TaxID=235986 RepID=A0A239C4D1_9ACTN|nr:DUF4241 domain-containing protein [Actinacidiphila glaucinigra]SNS15107.1 Protein of unknown function [Actinacidiphila glaucinigra]